MRIHALRIGWNNKYDARRLEIWCNLRGFYKCGRKYSLKIMRIKWYEITFIDNVRKWGILHKHLKKLISLLTNGMSSIVNWSLLNDDHFRKDSNFANMKIPSLFHSSNMYALELLQKKALKKNFFFFWKIKHQEISTANDRCIEKIDSDELLELIYWICF